MSEQEAKRTHIVTAWLNDHELARLDELCRATSRTRSPMLRYLLSREYQAYVERPHA